MQVMKNVALNRLVIAVVSVLAGSLGAYLAEVQPALRLAFCGVL